MAAPTPLVEAAAAVGTAVDGTPHPRDAGREEEEAGAAVAAVVALAATARDAAGTPQPPAFGFDGDAAAVSTVLCSACTATEGAGAAPSFAEAAVALDRLSRMDGVSDGGSAAGVGEGAAAAVAAATVEYTDASALGNATARHSRRCTTTSA